MRLNGLSHLLKSPAPPIARAAGHIQLLPIRRPYSFLGGNDMCLTTVSRGKQKKEVLSKLPETFHVYKQVRCRAKEGYTTYFGIPIHAGEMKAPYLGMAYLCPGDKGKHGHKPLRGERKYRCGWHAYTDKAVDNDITCFAKKKHIRAIGMQDDVPCVVLSHITFPKKCGRAVRTKKVTR